MPIDFLIEGLTSGVYRSIDYYVIPNGTKLNKINDKKFIIYPVSYEDTIFITTDSHKFSLEKEYINYFSGVLYKEDDNIIIEFDN